MMGWGVPEQGWRKGPWTPEEDKLLLEYVDHHGDGKWSSVAKTTGLKRGGKSCRLRWVNYLRPGLKRGQITPQEEAIIVELHSLWGNKWSSIARYLPGRTDNEIKNYWRTHFKKKEKPGPSTKERRKKYQMMKQKGEQHQHEEVKDTNDYDPAGAKEGQGMGEETGDMVYMCASNYDYNWDDDHNNGQTWPEVVMHDVGASETSMGEEGLWGGLWNLDDAHFGHFTSTSTNYASANYNYNYNDKMPNQIVQGAPNGSSSDI